jgi:hypothetical protein
MKFKSEMVLNDCRIALELLKNAEQKENSDLLRINWLTCVVLLRSVGYIIDKVDKQNVESNQMLIFTAHHESHKNEDIFRDFIDLERNLALKEYEFMFVEKETEEIETSSLLLQDGSPLLLQDNTELIINETKRIKKYFLKSGLFEKNALLSDVVQSSIMWWEAYIKSLKNKLTAPNSAQPKSWAKS